MATENIAEKLRIAIKTENGRLAAEGLPPRETLEVAALFGNNKRKKKEKKPKKVEDDSTGLPQIDSGTTIDVPRTQNEKVGEALGVEVFGTVIYWMLLASGLSGAIVFPPGLLIPILTWATLEILLWGTALATKAPGRNVKVLRYTTIIGWLRNVYDWTLGKKK